MSGAWAKERAGRMPARIDVAAPAVESRRVSTVRVTIGLACIVLAMSAGPAGAQQSPPSVAPRIAIVEATAQGVDPVVGEVATRRMRATAEQMGYAPVAPQDVRRALEQLDAPPMPSPAVLWRVMHAVAAERAVHARVWAEHGRYLARVQVASADGTGPFVARGEASAQELADKVDDLTRRALPPPGVRREASLPAGSQPEQEAGEEAFAVPEPGPREPLDVEPPLARRWRLALQTEAAIGTSGDAFYNHLVGGRVDFLFTRELRLGAYLGYANLEGRNGRASNLLTYLQLEDRVPVAPDSKLKIPLRLGFGYLPRNGPVLRLAAGLAYPLSDRLDLTLDLITPTFWVVRDRTLFSLNLAAEVGWRF